ncbi:exopolysaccharide biosynthesis polyprenyl glycosylphosphotransferase [Streptomyces gobiensis]|uniref:exopolysaccharide biosynthesis polyprenyl glycosylphosphotransferase n=1 Tax=Streptomyces gobiensis TaxID=2875706 RepID=UPI001E47D59F|nr:exopolysaccharide biosynthesis polyprenyl glycosylphosphotransferase [Streptomyces gobiensis]UGY90538.1 exopolysaccharide biosynthesis polyprenyl glycosylphosphotransferase [Streptomyces gobiensis]
MTTESADVPNSGRVMASPVAQKHAATSVFPPPRSAGWPATPPSRQRPYRRRTTAPLVLADCLSAAIAVTAVSGTEQALIVLGPGLPIVVLLNAHGGLYRPGLCGSALDELPTLFGRAAATWCATAAVLAAVRPERAFGWAMLLSLVLVHSLLACAGRGAVHLGRRSADRRHPRAALIVGVGPAGRRLTSTLYEHPEYGMRPVGLVVPGPDQEPGAANLPNLPDLSLPALTSVEDITRAVIQNTVRDAVFSCAPEADPQAAALVQLFLAQGCTVWLVNCDPATGAATAGVPGAGHMWGFGCRRIDPAPRRRPGVLGKRTLDLTVAALALVATAPLLLACALAVRLSDGPGVIFRQERIGEGGRRFVLLKFRTLLPADQHESATLWSVADDHRMSPVGRLLRRTSLDELPQLWNVLRGDMSLVGPRPERPYFVRQFSQTYPGYAARHRMPAGITGLAQVHGLRGDTSIEDRARFDNHYIETWSLWQDVRILLRTAASLVRLGGS